MSDYAEPVVRRRSADRRDVAFSTDEADGAAQMAQLLGSLVHSKVLPQLQEALGRPQARGAAARARSNVNSRAPVPRRPIEARDIDRLIALITEGGPDAARVLIEGLLAHGCERVAVFSDLLAPAARQLGDLWLDDRCSFTEVTIGVARLQALLRELALPVRADARRLIGACAIFAPCPPEQHGFGVAIVEEFFRSAGWRVAPLGAISHQAIEDALADNHVDLLGLSLSCEAHLGAASESLLRFRKASRNPDLKIMMGGTPFLHDAQLWREVGADEMALDGRDAVARAHELLAKTRLQR